MEHYKEVLLPITVSVGNFCWDGLHSCEHFDNEGGHPNCEYNLDYKSKGKKQWLKYNKKGGVDKPEYCKLLKEA